MAASLRNFADNLDSKLLALAEVSLNIALGFCVQLMVTLLCNFCFLFVKFDTEKYVCLQFLSIFHIKSLTNNLFRKRVEI